MSVEQTINDITALPVDEQLRIVHAIWDRLPSDAGTNLSERQKQELDRRWASYQSDPSSALTEQEFRQQVRDARG